MAGVRNRAYAGALLAAALLASSPAFAQLLTFDFNFSFVFGLDRGPLTGTFVVAPTGSPDVYSIQQMNGSLGGKGISGLTSYMGSDNLLKYPASPGYFTTSGVAFIVDSKTYNLFYSGSGGLQPYSITDKDFSSTYTGTVTPHAAPGPVAGAGIFSFLSLCLAGVATRLRTCVNFAKRILRRLSPTSTPSGSPAPLA
jgi:hypothetical protein